MTIAFYAAGGISSRVRDDLFIKNRRLIIAQSAYPSYPLLSIKKYLSHYKNRLLAKLFRY